MTHNPIREPSARHTTSRKRRGINGETQRPILDLLASMKWVGCTSGELQAALRRGHGQISGALSTLHKHGHVAMLSLRRDRQHVYVLPQYVDGRALEPRRNVTAHDLIYQAVAWLEYGNQDEAERVLRAYVNACEQRRIKR